MIAGLIDCRVQTLFLVPTKGMLQKSRATTCISSTSSAMNFRPQKEISQIAFMAGLQAELKRQGLSGALSKTGNQWISPPAEGSPLTALCEPPEAATTRYSRRRFSKPVEMPAKYPADRKPENLLAMDGDPSA